MTFMGKDKEYLTTLTFYNDDPLPLRSFCWLEQLFYSALNPNLFEKQPSERDEASSVKWFLLEVDHFSSEHL